MSPARRSFRVFVLASLALGPALACSDDTIDSGSENAEVGDTDELPAELGGPARGLRIVDVEVNQGTAVAVIRDGELIAADQRNAKLIRDRDTLIRVQHSIDDPDAWIARELTGILHIRTPGGAELIRTRTFTVSDDSDPRRLDSNFYFGVLAEEARPGSEFWIELRETDGSLDVSSLGEGDVTTPTTTLGLEDTPLTMHVVLVPVRYEFIDPPREPDITAEDLALFSDYLLEQNPVQSVDLKVREQPIVWTEQLSNLGSLLSPTREARLDDDAPPNVYYHALVDVGGPSINQVAGIASLTDASKDAGDNRVAATVYYKHVNVPDPEDEDQTTTVYPPTASARTFVHEVGHNQGFSHVACPNANAAGPDPSYPYADGLIGAYGFGIRDFHVYTPTSAHDYMTYCGNSWVSDWTWNKAFDRIQLLTSWDFEAGVGAKPEVGPLLVGLIGPDGFETWTVSRGVAPSLAAESQIEYRLADGPGIAVDARVELLSDDATLQVTAALPVALADLDGIEWVRPGRRESVDLARVRAR